jgi:hypothetical protein
MSRASVQPGENEALSYHRLRALIGYVGLSLPVALFLAGSIDGHVETSISAYYYSKMTIFFTGTLCVVGVFLVAYRFGDRTFEDIATTLAGFAALGVAFFHCAPDHPTLSQLHLANVHLACASTLFILLGAISFFIFPTDVPEERRWLASLHRAFGLAIWVSIALMVILNWFAESWYQRHNVFFWLESVCVMSFSLSFLIKGRFRVVETSSAPRAPAHKTETWTGAPSRGDLVGSTSAAGPSSGLGTARCMAERRDSRRLMVHRNPVRKPSASQPAARLTSG